MNIRVYNANQIGGCFTVVETNNARVMIDYGEVLPGNSAIQEEFDWEQNEIDAVFFTHYHGDHVGRILEIPKHIPLYIGNAARKVMLNIHRALSKIPELREEQQELVRVLESDRVHSVKEAAPIKIADGVFVTPYSVDHSAYDAYMYLIEADGEVALHTGDFRGHGYRGHKMLDVIQYYVHKGGRKVDYLITEGTMMGDRQTEKVLTEFQLQEKAREIFEENRYVFLVVSSTNLDSLASFYAAAKEKGMRLYCYNYYLYNQLKTFTDTAGEKSPLYQFDNVYTVNFDKELYSDYWEESKTQEELMREHGFLCIIKPEERYAEWIKRFDSYNPLVIYSMWKGYIDEKHPACNHEWKRFFEPYQSKDRFFPLHTSGHATAQMIERVIQEVAPRKEIIPMHTENVKGFRELNIDEQYKAMIRETSSQGTINGALMKLTQEERERMLDMRDDRSIPGELLRAYTEKNGAFHEFKKYVDGKKEFAVCLRGNSEPPSIIIYHNNHVVWELYYADQKYKVKISFNHARYTENWHEKLLRIQKLFAIKREIHIKKKDASIGYIVCEQPPNHLFYEKGFVEDTAEILLGIIDDFFKPNLNRDYFKEAVTGQVYLKEDKNALVEKRWQQTLFHYFKNTQDSLYAYDLEFSQKFPSSPSKENRRVNTIKEKLKGIINEPDMLAIRFKGGIPQSIVLVEVKSTYTACEGTSGINKHLKGMMAYSTEPFFVNNRRVEAVNMLNNLYDMGYFNTTFEEDAFANLPIERLLILTSDAVCVDGKEVYSKKGSAVKYYDEKKQNTNPAADVVRKCMDQKSSLWIIRDRYDKDFKVEKVYEV